MELTVARHVSSVAGWVLRVVSRRLLADSGARGWIVWTRKHAHADIGVDAVGKRCLDSTAQLRWAGEVGVRRRRNVLDIAVATSDHHLEIVTPLTGIGSGVIANWKAPERALVVGDTRRIIAARPWIDRRVSLQVHVERGATFCSVAVLLALNRVVRGQSVQTL